MSEDEFTTIRISKKNKERLGNLGTVNDDFDSVLTRLLDDVDAKKRKSQEKSDSVKK